jgi:hypothetical protein
MYQHLYIKIPFPVVKFFVEEKGKIIKKLMGRNCDVDFKLSKHIFLGFSCFNLAD